MTQSVALMRFHQTTNSKDVTDRVLAWKYDEPPIDLTDVPEFELEVDNESGVTAQILKEGKEIAVYRAERLAFPGVVSEVRARDGAGGSRATVIGVHRGYQALRRDRLLAYAYDENDLPAGTRDAIVVNPWSPFILREDGGTRDVNGQLPVRAGFQPDQYLEQLLRRKFLPQLDFRDARWFRASQYFAAGAGLQVYKNEKAGDARAFLQRLQTGERTMQASATIETVPVEPGDRNSTPSGDITSVDVEMYAIPEQQSVLAATTTLLMDTTAYGHDLDGSGWTSITTTGGDKYGDGYFSSSTTQYLRRAHAALRLNGDLSLFLAAKFDGPGSLNNNESLAFCQNTGGSGQRLFWLGTRHISGSILTIHYMHEKSDGSTFSATGTTNLFATGALHRVRLQRNTATKNVKVYVDGTLRIDATYTGVVDTPAGTETFGFGYAGFEPVSDVFNLYEGRVWGNVDAATITAMEKIENLSDHTYDGVAVGTELGCWLVDDTAQTVTRDPTLEVCRNARDGTRTYTAPTLTKTSIAGSTWKKYAATVAFSGSETTKNSLGFRVGITGRPEYPSTYGAPTSTKVAYIQAIVTCPVSGFPLTLGTIETYANPSGTTDDKNYLDDDFLNKTLLEALEAVRKSTEAGSSNPRGHWDMWVDENLAFHFKQRRGALIARTYSFANLNLREIDHQFNAKDIAHQVVAVGQGQGTKQVVLTDRTDYASGGMYVAANDPYGATRAYGDLPVVVKYANSRTSDLAVLKREARAFLKEAMVPREMLKVEVDVEHNRYFGPGDEITFLNPRTRTAKTMSVVKVQRSGSGKKRERVQVTLGQEFAKPPTIVRDLRADVDVATTIPQPAGHQAGFTGPPVYFDGTSYGVVPISIADGSLVDRVYVDVVQVPYTAPYKKTTSGGTPAVNAWGVETFKGDTPGASPVYAHGIELGIDVTVGSDGLPSAWSTDRHPVRFGSATTPQALRLDVTGYLDKDGAGVILTGTHYLHLIVGATQTNNAQKVAAASVTTIVTSKEAKKA